MKTEVIEASGYLALSYGQVALASLLLLVSGLASVLLGLRLGRAMMLGAARAAIQLLLVGMVLKHVFRASSPWPVWAAALVMIGVAGWSALSRAPRRYSGMFVDAVFAVAVCALATSVFAVAIVLGVRPWWSARYWIPLLGMVLGNVLNGLSIGLERFLEAVVGRAADIEQRLALGATRWEAALPMARTAIRAGCIPTINTLSVAGIVSLPGMMTGQLLGGVDPTQAVRYQLVILFAIASANVLGTSVAVLACAAHVVDDHHRLRIDRLRDVAKRRPAK